jgi:hypothetical protein
MERMGVSRVNGTADLLSLIGRAIEGLQRAVEKLDVDNRRDGLAHLTTVIREIDSYLERIDDDPLMRLAPLAPAHISEGLGHVRDDLALVVHDLDAP